MRLTFVNKKPSTSLRQICKSISAVANALAHALLEFVADTAGANAQSVHADSQTFRQRATILDLRSLFADVVLRYDIAACRIKFADTLIQAFLPQLFFCGDFIHQRGVISRVSL